MSKNIIQIHCKKFNGTSSEVKKKTTHKEMRYQVAEELFFIMFIGFITIYNTFPHIPKKRSSICNDWPFLLNCTKCPVFYWKNFAAPPPSGCTIASITSAFSIWSCKQIHNDYEWETIKVFTYDFHLHYC